MRSIFISLLLFLVASTSFAQQNKQSTDRVIMKNGDQYSGKITSYKQGDQLTLRTADGSELTILLSETSQVLQGVTEERSQQGKRFKSEKDFEPYIHPSTAGWYNITHLSFALGGGSEPGLALGAGISNVVGYQFAPLLGIGLGVGLDNYARRGETIYPLFIDVRSYFPGKEKPHSYFLSLSGGYGFAFARESIGLKSAEGGLLLGLGLGYRTTTKEGVDVVIDVGGRIQQASFSRDLFNGDIEVRDLTFQRFVIRMGIGLWANK